MSKVYVETFNATLSPKLTRIGLASKRLGAAMTCMGNGGSDQCKPPFSLRSPASIRQKAPKLT